MTENDEPRDSTGRFGFSMVLVMVLLICYPLSIGPVAKVYSRGSTPPVIRAFYAPLGWVYFKSPHFHAFMDAYVKLWGAHL